MRTTLAAVLLVVLLPAIVLADASSWALRTALDRATFAATVDRVMDEPAVEEAIADRATTAIVDTLAAAPGRLETVSAVVLQLAGQPTRTQIETALHDRILVALRTPAVEAARDDAVRAVHAFLLETGTARDGLVSVQGSDVVLDLSPIVERTAAAIDARLPRAGLADVPAERARIVLAGADEIRMVATTIDTLEALRIVIPLAVLVIIVLILALAHRRVRALGIVGIAVMVAGLVSIGLAWLGSGVVAGIPEDPTAGQIAEDAYEAFVAVLIIQSLILVALGLFIALLAWLLMGRHSPRSESPSLPADGA